MRACVCTRFVVWCSISFNTICVSFFSYACACVRYYLPALNVQHKGLGFSFTKVPVVKRRDNRIEEGGGVEEGRMKGGGGGEENRQQQHIATHCNTPHSAGYVGPTNWCPIKESKERWHATKHVSTKHVPSNTLYHNQTIYATCSQISQKSQWHTHWQSTCIFEVSRFLCTTDDVP